MREHTPSLNELREDHVLANTRHHDSYQTGVSVESAREAAGADFDRAIAAHDAALLRELADHRGVDCDESHDDDEWWSGYRQAQREFITWLESKANERSGR